MPALLLFIIPVRTALFTISALAMLCGSSLHAAVTVGWTGEFLTHFDGVPLGGTFHDVSGTVTIQDSNTIAFENFNYDGGGPLVYFYLTNDLGDVEHVSSFTLGPLLTGTVYNDDNFTLDLAATGKSLSDFSAISVWCEDFNVDFGSTVFAVPEPSSGLLFASAGVFSLFRRRRKCH